MRLFQLRVKYKIQEEIEILNERLPENKLLSEVEILNERLEKVEILNQRVKTEIPTERQAKPPNFDQGPGNCNSWQRVATATNRSRRMFIATSNPPPPLHARDPKPEPGE